MPGRHGSRRACLCCRGLPREPGLGVALKQGPRPRVGADDAQIHASLSSSIFELGQFFRSTNFFRRYLIVLG